MPNQSQTKGEDKGPKFKIDDIVRIETAAYKYAFVGKILKIQQDDDGFLYSFQDDNKAYYEKILKPMPWPLKQKPLERRNFQEKSSQKPIAKE